MGSIRDGAHLALDYRTGSDRRDQEMRWPGIVAAMSSKMRFVDSWK